MKFCELWEHYSEADSYQMLKATKKFYEHYSVYLLCDLCELWEHYSEADSYQMLKSLKNITQIICKSVQIPDAESYQMIKSFMNTIQCNYTDNKFTSLIHKIFQKVSTNLDPFQF